MFYEKRAERKVKAKNRPYHYVYKITNLVNGNIYVGMRSSILSPEEDTCYMSSSVVVENAIKKHGLENFRKEVTESFSSRDEAFELEGLIVDSEFIKRRDTYNQKVGGQGVGAGEDHPWYGAEITEDHKKKLVAGTKNFIESLSEEEKQRRREEKSKRTKRFWEDPDFRALQLKRLEENHPMAGKRHSEETKNKMSAPAKARPPRNHSEETKKKMSEARKKQPDVKCPHCSKEGAKSSMVRWHFDNCKYKLE